MDIELNKYLLPDIITHIIKPYLEDDMCDICGEFVGSMAIVGFYDECKKYMIHCVKCPEMTSLIIMKRSKVTLRLAYETSHGFLHYLGLNHRIYRTRTFKTVTYYGRNINGCQR